MACNAGSGRISSGSGYRDRSRERARDRTIYAAPRRASIDRLHSYTRAYIRVRYTYRPRYTGTGGFSFLASLGLDEAEAGGGFGDSDGDGDRECY